MRASVKVFCVRSGVLVLQELVSYTAVSFTQGAVGLFKGLNVV